MRSENNSDKVGIRADPNSEELLLEFDTNNREFQRGFECGEIWACLTDDVEEVHSIISADNAEMIMRMAEATGYSYKGQYITEEQRAKLQIGPGEWLLVVLRYDDAEGSE